MGDLSQDTHAITGLSCGVLSCPVLQTLHDLQRIIHKAVTLLAFHMNDGTDATVIMLEGFVIQAFLFQFFLCLCSVHFAGSFPVLTDPCPLHRLDRLKRTKKARAFQVNTRNALAP